VEGIMMNIDKFLPNVICEEYEYKEYFEKNENSLPTGIQENDKTFSYKNESVSFCGGLRNSPLSNSYIFCGFCIHYWSSVKQNKIHNVYQQPTNAL